ncbi:hypothetical protein BJF78_09020 [Pseudonocardia sp. CNS-139]|nr:hypothetical protein BJF78_09020 [Pseudonocardia sp. CNS-139]
MTGAIVSAGVPAARWHGAGMLVDHYLGITGAPGEHVVVAYTTDCREFAGYLLVTLRRRGVAARAVVMGAVRDDGVEDRLAAALPDPDASATGGLCWSSRSAARSSHTAVDPAGCWGATRRAGPARCAP